MMVVRYLYRAVCCVWGMIWQFDERYMVDKAITQNME